MTFGDWLCNSLAPFLLAILPLALWMLFWLFAVDCKKLWPWLAAGAWAPASLLLLMVSFAWSRVAPGECTCLGFVTIANFWWQLGTVLTYAALALFAGWLQGQLGYAPPEITFEPPAHEHGHGHDHGHGHGSGHH